MTGVCSLTEFSLGEPKRKVATQAGNDGADADTWVPLPQGL